MSNVLPPEERQAIWRLYRDRLIIAAALVGSACAIVFALALTPSLLTLSSQATPDSAPGATATAADRAGLASAQTLLNELSPILSASTTPSQAIDEALALRPSGVSVIHINYASGKPGQLILTGVAGTPQEIESYRTAVASSTIFSGVSVPVADLVGAQNGDFTMTLSGNF